MIAAFCLNGTECGLANASAVSARRPGPGPGPGSLVLRSGYDVGCAEEDSLNR